MKGTSKPLLVIALLLTLYLLQGVIIGFILTIPLYLDSRSRQWKQQGMFNFVHYPFSLKLAWAPIVDAMYITRFGRRKTWLIPIQFLLGVLLVFLSFRLTGMIEQVEVRWLTGVFFVIYFLLASQDVCVDGWALTLLADYHLQWASTCQTIGQSVGHFIGYTVVMTFESANSTNRYLREPFGLPERADGLFTLDQFARFWGIAFLCVSVCVALFLKDEEEEGNDRVSVSQTYWSIVELLKKKCVRQLVTLFLVGPIGYTASLVMTSLVLQRYIDLSERETRPPSVCISSYGVPREKLALLGIPPILVKIIVPLCITFTDRPLAWYYRAYFPGLFICLLTGAYVCLTPHILMQWYFYPILIVLLILNECVTSLMLVGRVGFYARISDPCIGGTYITLLSTFGNLGRAIVSSIVFYVADQIKTDDLAYPLILSIGALLGCCWLFSQDRTIKHLEALPVQEWHISK